MSKTKTGSNAQFTSTGKTLTTIGDHVYGYSGVLSCDDNTKTMMQFNTGKHYIKGKVQFSYVTPENQDFQYTIKFNGLVVQRYNVIRGLEPYTKTIFLIIPPLTEVTLTAQNVSDSAQIDQIVSITGKIYG
jgi:hypothetical protein